MAVRRKKKRILPRIFMLSMFVIIIVLGMYFFAESKKKDNKQSFIQDSSKDYDVMVCVDAGHGGHDVGADAFGRYEKDDTLRFALALREELHKYGIGVYMTRGDDTYFSPKERVEMAEKQDVKMLFSIHRNAYAGDKDVNGVEVWIHSQKPEDAVSLANDLLNNIEEIGHMNIRGIKSGTAENPDEDYTINTSKLTSCIFEIGYITSEKDNDYFDKDFDKNVQAAAIAIKNAVKNKNYLAIKVSL